MKEGQKIKVLVVDDASFMRRALTDILSNDEEIEVIGVAKQGQEALELIEAHDPDVITMDVDMPVMDGITTVKRLMIRQRKPVVMISSLGYQGMITLNAFRLGAVDFFPKPSGAVSLNIKEGAEELRRVIKQAAMISPDTIRRVRLNLQQAEKSVPAAANGYVVVFALRGASGNMIRMFANLKPSTGLTFLVATDIPTAIANPYSQALSELLSWHFQTNKLADFMSCQLESGEVTMATVLENDGLCAFKDDDMSVELSEFTTIFAGKPEKCMAVVVGGENNCAIARIDEVSQGCDVLLALSPERCVYGAASETVLAAQIGAQKIDSEEELYRQIEAFGNRLKPAN